MVKPFNRGNNVDSTLLKTLSAEQLDDMYKYSLCQMWKSKYDARYVEFVGHINDINAEYKTRGLEPENYTKAEVDKTNFLPLTKKLLFVEPDYNDPTGVPVKKYLSGEDL